MSKKLEDSERALVITFDSSAALAEWFEAARGAGLFEPEVGVRPADAIDVQHGARDKGTLRRYCYPTKNPVPLWVVHPTGTQTVNGQTVPWDQAGDEYVAWKCEDDVDDVPIVESFPAVGSIGASFLVGMAFAFGWTPCLGPILAAILTFAAQSGSVAAGGVLRHLR